MQEPGQTERTQCLRSAVSIRIYKAEQEQEGRKVKERERGFAYMTILPSLWGMSYLSDRKATKQEEIDSAKTSIHYRNSQMGWSSREFCYILAN